LARKDGSVNGRRVRGLAAFICLAVCRSGSSADSGAEPVQLLDAGAAPRARLAYTFTRPPRPFTSVSQSGRMLLRGLFQGEDAYTPPLYVSWVPAGDAGWRIARVELLSDDKVPAPRRAALAGLARQLEGREVKATVDASGSLSLSMQAGYDAAEDRALFELRRLLALQLTAPLPQVPCGVGARWRRTVELPLEAAGAARITLDYTLVDSTPTSIDLEVAARIGGAVQPARLAGGGIERGISLSQLEGQGHGRIVRLLDEPTPVVSELELEAVMTLSGADTGAGYKLVVRSRDLMQADRLGPPQWDAPPEGDEP
jgi:hypothetical protein